MGINPTPTNHRSFTFDGKSTREFGVYTTGKDVFNSPERAVEMISIPGRDGEYALDKGHFNNIEVTYRAGIVADSTTDFAEAISNFRNWLASRKGYCRLTDEYNTEEYRMAVFKNAIALEHEGLLTGEFDVTFDCKPQRYLAIGEELVEIGAWGNTEEVSGDIATFDAGSATKIKEVTVDITPVQSGSGTPSPDNIRPITGFSAVDTTVCGINIWDEEWEVGGYSPTTGEKVVWANGIRSKNRIPIVPNTEYYFNVPYSVGSSGLYVYYYDADGNYISNVRKWSNSFTTVENARYINFELAAAYGTTYNNDISINYPSTDTDYHAYNGTNYTTSLGTTVYGGTLDVTTGELTVTHGYIADLSTKTWAYQSTWQSWYTDYFSDIKGVNRGIDIPDFLSDSYVAIASEHGLTPQDMVGITSTQRNSSGCRIIVKNGSSTTQPTGSLCYELQTPTTTTLTPQQVAVIANSVNNVWANSGDVTVEYGHNPTILTNPTWFPSKPLLAVEGYGLLKLGKSEIDLDNVPVGDITLLDDSRFRLTQTAANTYSVTFTIDEGALNVGDDITASINALPFRFYIVGDGASISPSSYTVADTNSDFVSSLSLGYGGSGADFSGETVINVKFDSGTSSTITNTVSGNLVVKKTYPTPTSNITLTYSVTETVAYDASTHTITLTETATITYSSAYIASAQLRTTSLGASALITAYSTISIIQDEVFIDCDIGEAYTIKDGEPISLNQHIDLGSDLPTLPSGDTEVTYDNTITKVEVRPNWWKV